MWCPLCEATTTRPADAARLVRQYCGDCGTQLVQVPVEGLPRIETVQRDVLIDAGRMPAELPEGLRSKAGELPVVEPDGDVKYVPYGHEILIDADGNVVDF
jgi:hypothetical protein